MSTDRTDTPQPPYLLASYVCCVQGGMPVRLLLVLPLMALIHIMFGFIAAFTTGRLTGWVHTQGEGGSRGARQAGREEGMDGVRVVRGHGVFVGNAVCQWAAGLRKSSTSSQVSHSDTYRWTHGK